MSDLVQKLVGALENFTEGCSTSIDAYAVARAALSEAKAGGWLPIEQASDEDKRRCWVLVGESVHLAAYIEIGFEGVISVSVQ